MDSHPARSPLPWLPGCQEWVCETCGDRVTGRPGGKPGEMTRKGLAGQGDWRSSCQQASWPCLAVRLVNSPAPWKVEARQRAEEKRQDVHQARNQIWRVEFLLWCGDSFQPCADLSRIQ